MQTSLFRKSAVLIENNPLHRRLYGDILEANGFDVYAAKSPMDGLIKVKETGQDIVVINADAAEESFMEKLIVKMKTERASDIMPIVGLSSYNIESKKKVAEILDVFLTKPFSIDKLIGYIFACIEDKANGCQSSDHR